MIRFSSEGRGRNYTALRGGIESTLRFAYAGGWPAALWGLFERARRVECRMHALPLLPPGARPLRIGFASDLHLGPTTPSALLDDAFAALARARLDVLLLGGDYVFLDATREKARELAARVRAVPATTKLAVLGNHDLWTHHALLESALEEAGVTLLTNASARLGAPHEGTAIVGLDEPWTGRIDATAAFAACERARAIVVLCHSPDGVPHARSALAAMPNAPRALYVCGHTHGGHVATPWGPLVVPGRLGKRFPHGMHSLGTMELYVSRGVGGIEVPIRAFARPEIAIFDLLPRAD